MHSNSLQLGFAALSIAALLITACGGGGGGGSATGTTTVLSAYVANYGGNNISHYTVDPTTGALTAKGTISTGTGSGPTSIAVAVYGGYAKYAYVANRNADISQFTIGAGGALQAMSPATVPSGPNGYSPTSVAVDPGGKYLYAVNPLGNQIAQFAIGNGGALSAMSTPTVTFGTATGNYDAISIDPTGNYVYVADQTNNLIAQFTIGGGGALIAMGTPTVSTGSGTGPISIGFDPAGKYAYVVNWGTGAANTSSITQYSISPTTGALTSPYTATPPTQLNIATSIVIDHAGSYAYVAYANGVYQLPINSTNGNLDTTGGPTTTTGNSGQSVAIDPSDKVLFFASQYGSGSSSPGSVWTSGIGSGGTLSALSETPAGNLAYFVATAVTN